MIQSLRPYTDYTDSGLPWIGKFPSHWKLVKAKYLFSERVEKGFPTEPLLAATQTKGVVPKNQYEFRTMLALKDLHLLKLVNAGDYVISLRSFQGGIEYAHHRGIISPAYTVLIPSGQARREFFAYFFKSAPFVNSLTLFVTGIREGQNIDYNQFRRAMLPEPPKHEQKQIGKFLDWQLRKIDHLIKMKRRLIILLNEQKQAIIHQAVTRGLNPNVKLKPSGVDWLGDIPEHWTVMRLRMLVTSIDQGVSPQAEARLANNDTWGVLKAGCVNRGVFRDTEHKRLPPDFKFDSTLIVHTGDVLVSRASGSPKLVGSVGRVASLNYRLILSDKTFRLNFKQPRLADFFVATMNTHFFRLQVEQAISGAEGLANNLPVNSLKDFFVTVPPVHEGVKIAEYLKLSTAEIDHLIEMASREISLVTEYRTRLIADMVTGKLNVRDIEIPLITDVLTNETEESNDLDLEETTDFDDEETLEVE